MPDNTLPDNILQLVLRGVSPTPRELSYLLTSFELLFEKYAEVNARPGVVMRLEYLGMSSWKFDWRLMMEIAGTAIGFVALVKSFYEALPTAPPTHPDVLIERYENFMRSIPHPGNVTINASNGATVTLANVGSPGGRGLVELFRPVDDPRPAGSRGKGFQVPAAALRLASSPDQIDARGRTIVETYTAREFKSRAVWDHQNDPFGTMGTPSMVRIEALGNDGPVPVLWRGDALRHRAMALGSFTAVIREYLSGRIGLEIYDIVDEDGGH